MSVIYFIFQQTMLFTIPLMIVALGGMFSERSGVVNIALEGIMTMGAFTGILFLNMTGDRMSGQLQLLLAILISTATGAVFAFFHAYASINMKANQTISGTALNMFAPAFAIFVARVIQGVQQIQFSNTFRIESVPLLGNIPFFGPLLFRNTYITTYLGIVILVLSTLVLYRTRFGLRLRSCGEHPHAADAAGINVCRMQYAGVLISGVLGGLGGLVFVVPTSTNFNADVAGYGFLALAIWRKFKKSRGCGRIRIPGPGSSYLRTVEAGKNHVGIPVLRPHEGGGGSLFRHTVSGGNRDSQLCVQDDTLSGHPDCPGIYIQELPGSQGLRRSL